MVKYVILGGGIIGLFTAFNLLQDNVEGSDIVIISKHTPGDLSLQYASPYAGAVFASVKSDIALIKNSARYSYKMLGSLNKILGEICLEFNKITEYFDEFLNPGILEDFQSYVEEFKVLKEDLPEGAKFGISFKTWIFNPPLLMEKLLEYLKSNGVRLIKKEIAHVDEAYIDGCKILFNCTGIGASKLGGVMDKDVFPTRAQVVVAEAPHVKECVFRWGRDSTYIIKRPNSNGEVILGGFYQPHNWTPDVLGEETLDILERTSTLCPELLSQNARGNKFKDLEIKRVVAAYRPSRIGGPLVKKEVLNEDRILIHNYGAAGNGYQLGLGLAKEGISLSKTRIQNL